MIAKINSAKGAIEIEAGRINNLALRLDDYREIKTVLQETAKSSRAITRGLQESQAIDKYDDNFFEQLYTLLDNNVDEYVLSNFVLGYFDDYEFGLFYDFFDNINETVNVDESATAYNDLDYTRGTAKLLITFRITAGVLAGYLAGKIYKLALALTEIGASLGIIGVLIGMAIVGTVMYYVDKALTNWIAAYGKYYESQWVGEIFSISGLFIPTITVTLNIVSIILNVFL